MLPTSHAILPIHARQRPRLPGVRERTTEFTGLIHVGQHMKQHVPPAVSGTLTNADCLDALPELANESIDIVITDPPYCLGAISSDGLKASGAERKMILPFFVTVCAELGRVMKIGSHAYIHTDWRTISLLTVAAERGGLTTRNLIVWNKQRPGPGSWYRCSHELILFCTKGPSKREFGASQRDVWDALPIPPGKRFHRAEKPASLIKRMMENSSKPGDIVLDPFSGSASVAAVAQETGRSYIGFEVSTESFTRAAERFDNLKQKQLF